MKAKVLKDFFDAKEEQLRLVGEVFELSSARFDEIIKRGGLWIEEVAEETREEAEETREEAEEIKEAKEVKEKPKKKAGASNGGKK